MKDRIETVADILMAAAHADHHVEPEEVTRIEELLREILGVETVPDALIQRLADFEPDAFDMGQAVAPFQGEAFEVKRKLMDMCYSVHDSDGELDFAEDTFIRELGVTLGLKLEDFKDLLLEFLPGDGADSGAS